MHATIRLSNYRGAVSIREMLLAFSNFCDDMVSSVRDIILLRGLATLPLVD